MPDGDLSRYESSRREVPAGTGQAVSDTRAETDPLHLRMQQLRRRLRATDPPQDHLLQFWDELDRSSQHRLLTQIESADLSVLNVLKQPPVPGNTPLQEPDVIIASEAGRRAFVCGEQEIRDGKVAVAVVAGGLGTRLGFPGPKALFPIGPVTGKCLLQVLLEKVVAIERRCGSRLPVLIMTSDETHAGISEFLDRSSRCGLAARDVRVFSQASLPAVDRNSGRILMRGHDQLVFSPDGHGGFLSALGNSEGLSWLEARGTRVLNYCQIDNPLAPVADPSLIGLHRQARAEVTTLVIRKRSPVEKTGTAVCRDGKHHIIEYSEFRTRTAGGSDPGSTFPFPFGNTGIHMFDLEFLRRVSRRSCLLPLHVCCKPASCLPPEDGHPGLATGQACTFERFIFDLLPYAVRSQFVAVHRDAAFAPVKNHNTAETDTPAAAQQAMITLHRRQLRELGVSLAPDAVVEISSLSPLNGQDVRNLAATPPEAVT